MNRSAKQLALFDSPFEYEMFLQVLAEADRTCPIRLLEYCVMPNHWHLLVWPERDDQLSRYMRWITGVHGQRWRKARGQSGRGAVYQGRYRWVGVQDGQHFDIARQYIRQNPVRAGLVASLDDWPWSSASRTSVGLRPSLAQGPRSLEWTDPGLLSADDKLLDVPTAERMRTSLRTGHPFGDAKWSRALEVRSWLTAVLEAHSRAQAAGGVKNASKTTNF